MSIYEFLICFGFIYSSIITTNAQSLNRVYDLNNMPVQRDQLLNRHNHLRRSQYASNMQEMVWDAGLADVARNYAAGCNAAHSASWSRGGRWSWVGENLWWYSTYQFPNDLGRPIQDFYDEIYDYNYNYNSCNRGRMCGHYTQVVWATSCAVGCSIALCDGLVNSFGIPFGHYVVCNYGPGGNIRGQRPFRTGSPCSECPGQCRNGLCASQCSGTTATFFNPPQPRSQPTFQPQPQPQPAPAAVNDCQDKDYECDYFARIGECQRNPAYMHPMCPIACGLNRCGGGGKTAVVTGVCQDNDWQCSYWASIGECNNNPLHMHSECKQSCNVCNGATNNNNCFDLDFECWDFANKGECNSNPAWMLQYCKKSCGIC